MKKQIIGMVLSFVLGSLSLISAAVQKQDYKRVEVADGIYAFIADESITGAVQGNVILIVGDTEALIVDSGQYPSLARRMLKEIQTITPNPVRYLINTHWHGDHLLANHIFREAYPNLQVVTHAETKRFADKLYSTWPEDVKGFPKMIETLRQRVASGKKKDGTPLSEEEKMSYQLDADALELMLDDAREAKYEPPDVTFINEITFYLGNREVTVTNLGPGNTPGDAILYVPDSKVLITGDVVVFPTPYSFGSYHSEWIDVLNKLSAMGAEQIVPGHGPVMKDASYLKTLVALLEEVRTQVRAAVQDGLSLEETRKRVNLSKWGNQLAGDNKHRHRAFKDFFENPGIEQAYKEAKGESRDSS